MNTGVETYLVTGGSRSGKSTYALNLCSGTPNPFFIATGWAGDEEMRQRIEKHRRERGPEWTAIETRTDIPSALLEAERLGATFIVVDCLTLWTSNVLFECPGELEKKLDELCELIGRLNVPTVFVTNEVGSGIVPADRMTREFRDAAGMVNRLVAGSVKHVFLCVCGLPLKIK